MENLSSSTLIPQNLTHIFFTSKWHAWGTNSKESVVNHKSKCRINFLCLHLHSLTWRHEVVTRVWQKLNSRKKASERKIVYDKFMIFIEFYESRKKSLHRQKIKINFLYHTKMHDTNFCVNSVIEFKSLKNYRMTQDFNFLPSYDFSWHGN
jgi:hypothetical protein